MNKRDEIFKVFCKKDYCSDSDDDQYPLCVLKEDCRNVSYVDSIISITNRVKCPACNTGWKKPLLCDCKDGWIYPDPQKMYEALKLAVKDLETAEDYIEKNMKNPTEHPIGRMRGTVIITQVIQVLKQTIKGE